MCQQVKCQKCGKPSWSGCGAHAEQVLRDVPKEKRCQCVREQPKSVWNKLFGK